MIVVNDKVYYEENGVAVFEFFSSIKKWIASNYQIFEYTSVESADSPDLQIFVNTDHDYQLYSAYQRYKCNTCFSKQEICNAFVDLKNEVCKRIVIPKKFDFCFADRT